MTKPFFMNRKTLLQALALIACILSSITALADEPVVVYNAGDKTLTFYYESRPSGHMGTAYYDLNSGSDAPDWYYDDICESVTRVVFDWSFAKAEPTTTYGWFLNMKNLQSVTGMKYLKTSAVTNMAYMFYGCESLTDIDLSYFNTAGVTSMYGMFYGCRNLSSIDLSQFNTASVTNMGSMFRNCGSLQGIDLSSFDTHQVTKTSYMFAQCGDITTIFVGNGWSMAGNSISTGMFVDCVNLVGGVGTTYDPGHTDAAYAHVDLGSSNPGYLTGVDTDWTKGYAVYTPSDSTITFYCDNLHAYREGKTFDLNSSTETPAWIADGTGSNVAHVAFDASFIAARPTSTFKWFYNMKNLYSIKDLIFLNTSHATNMAGMFRNCEKLTSLDLSGLYTDNVIEMTYMFAGCKQLKSLDLRYLVNPVLADMTGMFDGCSQLTDLNLEGFTTSKVTVMDGVFNGCASLNSLDLSSFNTISVTEMQGMFNGCVNLVTINVSDKWTTDAVIYSLNMFDECFSLVGGMGTTYDANHVDAAYAHIDGGMSSPGYFTGEQAFIRGDVNGDGNVNISDVSALIDMVLTRDGFTPCADTNFDGSVNISDVSMLIDYILSGQW